MVQERLIKSQVAILTAKNLEVEEAVGDLVELVTTVPLKDGTPAASKRHINSQSKRLRELALQDAKDARQQAKQPPPYMPR